MEIGYKSVEQAWKECEKLFGRELNLPLQQPPIAFTHRFGRCSHIEAAGSKNDHFEIEYVHEGQGKNHYMVRVNPVENRIKDFPRKKDVIRTYTLKDGSKAVYGTTPSTHLFSLLVFERDGWQYILSVDRRVEASVPAEVFVKIAESVVGFPPENDEASLLHR